MKAVGKIEKALRVLDAMVTAGLKPDAFVYTTLINGYVKIERIDEGLNLFKEMSLKRVKPTAATYSTVLKSLFQARRIAAAKQIFIRMIESKVPVNLVTCTVVRAVNMKFDKVAIAIMISTLFKARRIEEAKDLFLSTNGPAPSVVTCNIMMTNLIKEGLLAEADDVFTTMERIGCSPNSQLLNNVVRVLLRKGEIVGAGDYLSKIDKNNLSLEASTVVLLISLFSKGRYKEHVKLLPEKYHLLLGAR
ncbi:hypothetical protein QOZ80_7BG0607310 [Eleusine coracana subsp. coracana]|nr:hypothetical protein QOZ80_7BG0607310 [Eleusine coracana subsp. coracana]